MMRASQAQWGESETALPAVSTASSRDVGCESGPSLHEVFPLSVREQVAIGRLRRAAMRMGLTLDELVDDLLADRFTPTPPPSETATALVTEVKGLLERLASDIPAQMALKMEAALRDMAPAVHATPCPPDGRVGVSVSQGPREVQSYRAKRAPVARHRF